MKAMDTSIRSQRAAAALAIGMLIAMSGCTDKRAGIALPTTSTPSSTTTVDPFNGLKACDVLDKALEGQGFPPAVVDVAGGDNDCKSDKAQYGGLSLALQPDQGIDHFNTDPSKIHDGTIHDRRIAEIRNGIRPAGDCAIALEVTKTSRVFITSALSVGTTEETCKFVEGVAEKVEPQLPRGN